VIAQGKMLDRESAWMDESDNRLRGARDDVVSENREAFRIGLCDERTTPFGKLGTD
jgi:hypothetical protein